MIAKPRSASRQVVRPGCVPKQFRLLTQNVSGRSGEVVGCYVADALRESTRQSSRRTVRNFRGSRQSEVIGKATGGKPGSPSCGGGRMRRGFLSANPHTCAVAANTRQVVGWASPAVFMWGMASNSISKSRNVSTAAISHFHRSRPRMRAPSTLMGSSASSQRNESSPIRS